MTLVPNGYVNTIFKFATILGGSRASCGIAWHLNAPGVFDPDDLDALYQEWEEQVLPVVSAAWQGTGATAIVGQVGDPVILEHSEVDTCGGAPSSEVSNISWVIHKLSAVGGRKNRGRMFIPGVPEIDCNVDGRLTPGAVTAMGTAVAQFMVNVKTDVAIPVDEAVILHTNEGNPTNITQLVCSGVVGHQDRRLRR